MAAVMLVDSASMPSVAEMVSSLSWRRSQGQRAALQLEADVLRPAPR